MDIEKYLVNKLLAAKTIMGVFAVWEGISPTWQSKPAVEAAKVARLAELGYREPITARHDEESES